MRRNRSTKIVATLGPASGTPEVIGALFDAGVDVFRLNFSHGTHDEHRVRYDVIRAIEQERKRPIGILVDLQGPKLRVGTFADGKIMLKAGQGFRLDLTDKPGDETRAPLPHPEIFEAISPGTDLLLDDGRIRLRVEKVRGKVAETLVITGGPLSNRKGVNVPNAVLPVSALTDKDRRDLRFGLDIGADWIALSFVQRPEDVAEARKLIEGRAAVMVKLEKPQAIERLQEILDLTDAVMVARGDLGVEMPPEDVPGLQKRIVRACRVAGKPVVVATQMLESMVQSPAPTRAEASDVATAVYDGADAVMLSAETAAGAYPREAVEIMNRIIAKVEQDPLYRPIMDAEHSQPEHTAADAISAAAAQVSQTIGAAAICTFTTSGSTTLRAARERPTSPILGLTAHVGTARRLAVLWGVHWVLTRDIRSFSDMVERARKLAVQEGFARSGDRIVITAGVPFGTPGSTNTLRIAWVE
ncbi:pyruvate kinase [Stella humosa]|uniref:Pyruvate kinase n=1 Tax=Stella humosa TaxID=94 RepID=A0A3N1KV25_9PROT|nr:pyruvate kinase [Stella humosa]ROP83097.1 pyruvate kinase [Stella humosa]BBK30126.1 pyruvate kinase [Stella humosa]